MGVALSPIMDYQMMLDNSHYQQRGVFESWVDIQTGEEMKGATPVPRFKNNPSRTVRGGAPYDHDTKDVLLEHGYTAEEIDALYSAGILNHGAK